MHITRILNNNNQQPLSDLVHILIELQINDFISELTSSSSTKQIALDNQEEAA